MVTDRPCSLFLVPGVSNYRLNRAWMAALFGVLVLFACVAEIGAAQTIQFDGTQRPVALGFSEPEGLAVDQYGNLFVADAQTFEISEILAVNGQIPANPTVRLLYRDTVSNPQKVAVDRQGNVYFTDLDINSNLGNNTIKEILAVNGVIPTSPTVIQLGSGLSYPHGIAVDSSGDLFVADTDNQAIKEFVAVNGSIPQSPTILTIGSGWSAPKAVAVDVGGNLYVADSSNHAVKEILAVNGTIPSSPTIVTLAANYCSPDGVSLDTQGNLYFSDYCNDAIYEILTVNGSIPASPVTKTIDRGSGLGGVSDVAVDSNENIYAGGVFSGTQIPQVYPSDFGSIIMGSTTGATPLLFTMIGPVTIGSISVVPTGAEGQDFTYAGGTCAPGASYGLGYSICTVDVMFTPKAPGTRSGAVLLKDLNGNTLAAGYVHGTGVAPLVNFAPPVQSTVVSNVPGASGVALDATGNLYIAAAESQILKETPFGGSYIQSVIPTGSLNTPRGVAVDSAGNIYVADTGNNRVLKETPSPTGFTEATVDSLPAAPAGVAVDEDGHFDIVYGTDGVFTGYGIDGYLGTGLSSASGVAVDTSGNLYIASYSTPGSILKETLIGTNYASSTIPLSGVNAPAGISVDVFGNLYVSYTDGNGAGQVAKLTPSSSGYIQSTIPTQGLSQPAGLAVDSSGNIFIADSGNSRVVKVDLVDPSSLSFASMPWNSHNPDSPQTVTLTNAGNFNLIFPIPASANNPSIAPNFTLDSNGPSACPVIGSGSYETGWLAGGSSCVLSIGFAPTTAGNLSGFLTLTDNNLNPPAPGYVTQSISLSGIATPVSPTITWSAPGPITYGTALSVMQLNATANVPGTFSYSPAAGAVLSAGTQQLTVTFTPLDTTNYTNATASVPLTVNKAMPVVSWTTPTPITSGTALSASQLDATANIPGTFAYSPAAGTILAAGISTLSVVFTPNDAVDYTTASASVSLLVNPVPGFILTVSPPTVSITQSSKASFAVFVHPTGGFSGNVTLAVSGLPKGVTATFSPNPTTTNSAIFFSANGGATTGTSSVTITGSSSSLVQTTTVALTVVHK